MKAVGCGGVHIYAYQRQTPAGPTHSWLLKNSMLLIALLFFSCNTEITKLLESFMIQSRTLVLLYMENGSLNIKMTSNYFPLACIICYYFIAVYCPITETTPKWHNFSGLMCNCLLSVFLIMVIFFLLELHL